MRGFILGILLIIGSASASDLRQPEMSIKRESEHAELRLREDSDAVQNKRSQHYTNWESNYFFYMGLASASDPRQPETSIKRETAHTELRLREDSDSDEDALQDKRSYHYINWESNFYCIFAGSVQANEGETIYLYETDRVNCQRCTCDRSGGRCEFCYKHCTLSTGAVLQEGETVYVYENDPGRCQKCTCSGTGGSCEFCHPFGNYWCHVAGQKLYVNHILYKNRGTNYCQKCTCTMGPLDKQPRGACHAC